MKKLINIKLPVFIAGKGLSGSATYDLLLLSGLSKDDILFCDPKNEPIELEKVLSLKPQTIVVSPGIALTTSWLLELVKQGCELTSEFEIATNFLSTEKIIAITGSVGKSTTAALVSAGLKAAGISHFLGGNFGTPLSRYVIEKIKTGVCSSWLVLEMSSYQLENYKNLSVDYSIFTYLTPNHLERYNSLKDYYDSKFFLHKRTKFKTFINSASQDLVYYFKKNASEKNYISCLPYNEKLPPESFSSQLGIKRPNLIGNHNLENIGLVFCLAEQLSLPLNFYFGVLNYNGLPHRLQKIYDQNNIAVINDSKATTIESVKIALQSVVDENPKKIWLLLGGKDKQLPWENLQNNIYSNVECILFGECASLIKLKLKLNNSRCFSKLYEALDFLYSGIQENETVLLSPGGTSLDEFKNFEARGDFFTQYSLKKLGDKFSKKHE